MVSFSHSPASAAAVRHQLPDFRLAWLQQLWPAGLWGYVEYPVMGLASGLAPFSAISNSTQPLNRCIEVLSGGGASPIYGGRNVSAKHQLDPVLSWEMILFCFLDCFRQQAIIKLPAVASSSHA